MSNPIKSAEMAPVLQSMQDYICNHFTDELMDEVSSAVSLGLVEDLDIDAEGGKPVVQRNESKIIRTEFWRLDCTKLLADIKMRVKSAYRVIMAFRTMLSVTSISPHNSHWTAALPCTRESGN